MTERGEDHNGGGRGADSKIRASGEPCSSKHGYHECASRKKKNEKMQAAPSGFIRREFESNSGGEGGTPTWAKGGITGGAGGGGGADVYREGINRQPKIL